MTRTQFIQQATLAQFRAWCGEHRNSPPELEDMQRMLDRAAMLAGVLEKMHDERSIDDVVEELRELDKSLQLIANELPNASRGS